MSSFWNKLPKPFFALAPLSDVTDAAFRRIIAKYGKPDVFFTEFVSCAGLLSEGREALLHNFKYSEEERPIVAQVFGADPKHFYECAKIVDNLGFNGIDINMGCPDKSVEKQGAGAVLMKDSKRAREIIKETKRGAGKMPVSVKTRIGYNKNELEAWLQELLAEEPAAITVHARTRKELSKVPANWDEISRAVDIRNKLGSKTLIIGNGDIKDIKDGRKKAQESGVDGVMLGRAVFGNPWLFVGSYIPTTEEKLRVMIEHTKLFEELLSGNKNFAVMKKHYKAYVSGWNGAKELRIKLMDAKNAKEVESIVAKFHLKK
jgi:nifR3 family TIM-barrel protein